MRDHETNWIRAETWLIDHRAKSNASRARRYDADALVAPFGAGDWVLMHMPTAVKGLSQKLIDQFRGPYRVVGPHTSRAGALAPNVLDLVHVKSGATKSANVERLHLYHPSLEWLIADNVNHHGGSPVLRALSPSLGVGVRIWFRWDQGWAAATLERRANTRERLRETDGTYVPLEDSWRILDDDGSRAVVALLPSERGDGGKWNFDESSDPARRSGLLLSAPILIADVSVGDIVLVAGGPALTCGQVLHVNVDADTFVVHELGGTEPDLARRAFAHKYHDPVTNDTVFTGDPRDTYEPCISMRRPRDIVLPVFTLSSDDTLPRSVVRGLLAGGAAVAALHFGP